MLLNKKSKTELNYILFEVTQICNLNCSFCYNHWKGNFHNKNNGRPDYIQLSNTLSKLFKTANLKHITFTGGEPLLVERLKELALFSRMKGASVSIITNGNAGRTEDILQLINIGVTLFELPFHSFSPYIHDLMTGVNGSWLKSKESIRIITEMGGFVVPVIVITKHNYKTIGETLSVINSMGFKRIMLNRYNIGGININSPEKVLPSKQQLNEAFRQANETGKKFNLELSSNVCTPHCVVDPRLYKSISFTNCSPDVAKRPLTLTSDGDIRFCNHSPTVIGNIFNEPVEEILLKGKKLSAIFTQPEFCINCKEYNKCLGGCRAAAEQTGKTFSDVDPYALIECENLKTEIA